MKSESGFSGVGIVVSFLVGASTGAVVALLLAPASGKETRHKLMDITTRSKERIKGLPKALRAAYRQGTEAAREAYEHERGEVAG